MNENEKHSAEWILMLYIHFPLTYKFPSYIWWKLNKLLKYNKYQLTKRYYKEDSKVSSEFPQGQ